MTTEIHHLDMATMGRDIVATMDSSVIALPIKIVQTIQITGIRNKIETSFEIPHINQNSSYRSQYNDQEGEENCSPSSICTKYLQLQICMLKLTASLQGPSINSDEFSASQSCSSNLSQLGYNQTTPSSVMTLPVVGPPGPTSSNELGNQQGPTSSIEVQPLTPSLSSSLTLPASEQILATPTINQSSTEPRFPANQIASQRMIEHPIMIGLS